MAEYIERGSVMRTAHILRPEDKELMSAISIIPTVSVPQWISVKDRLPEDGENVLIWYEYFRYGSYNRMYKTYEIAYQYDGFWSGVNPLGQKARVFAWMPLPDPPKGEQR